MAVRDSGLEAAASHARTMLAPPTARLLGKVDQSVSRAESALAGGDESAAVEHFAASISTAREHGYL